MCHNKLSHEVECATYLIAFQAYFMRAGWLKACKFLSREPTLCVWLAAGCWG